jgi:hypothetical protein
MHKTKIAELAALLKRIKSSVYRPSKRQINKEADHMIKKLESVLEN